MAHADALSRAPQELETLKEGEADFRYVHTITDDGAIMVKKRKEAEAEEEKYQDFPVDEILILKPLDSGELQREQIKEQELKWIIAYLENAELPEDDKDQKRILAKSMMYGINEEGTLIRYEGHQCEEGDEYGDLPELVVVPSHLTQEIMEQHHASNLGGHFGPKKLLETYGANFFGKQCMEIVRSTVENA